MSIIVVRLLAAADFIQFFVSKPLDFLIFLIIFIFELFFLIVFIHFNLANEF